MSRSTIQYPYALSDGELVHIAEVISGQFECVGCAHPMVARRGKIRQHHFAHKPPFDDRCDPDHALHQMAQLLILESYGRAQSQQSPYRVGRYCTSCGQAVMRNVTMPHNSMGKEESVVDGTRSDLVVYRPHRSPVIMEIVVTHDLEPETRIAYEESAIPVFVKRLLTFDDLKGLDSEFVADESINVPETCQECQSRQDEERRVFERRKRTVDRATSSIARTPSSEIRFQPWYTAREDMWGRPTLMYPRTQRVVFANAVILTECGFEQHNPENKPWLFRFRVREDVYVYADLGGSDVEPIYRDTAAMLYPFGPGLNEDEELSVDLTRYLIKAVGEHLQDAGCDVGAGGVNPLDHVDARRLAGLIRYDVS